MGKLDSIFHHVVLLNSLKDAGPEVHRAVLDGKVSEDELHKHLSNFAQKLHADMKSSAESNPSDGRVKDGDGKKSSTAAKTLKFLRDSDADSRPTGAAELGSEDRTSRREKVGKLFKS